LNKVVVIALILIMAVILGWFALSERPASLIPREVLFDLPEKISPKISPDGSRVAYLAPYGKVLNVWLHDRGTKTDRILTQDKGRGIHYYSWAPDGKSILFLQDQGGNENWHLYKIALTGGGAKDMTPFDGVQARVLNIDKHFPGEILVELNKEDASRHDVYRLNLKTGALVLAARNTGQISDWIVDPEMKVRGAVATRAEGGYDVLVRENEGSEWRKLFSWDLEDSMMSSVVGFSKNGKELYLIDSRGRDTAGLVRMDLVTGKTETIFSDPEYDVSGVAVDPDDREIERVSVYRARNEWTALRDSVRKDLEILRKAGAGDLLLGNRSYDGRYWVVGFDNDVSPLNYYVYDRTTEKNEFLFTHRPALTRYKLAPMEAVRIRARDGLKLQGYLTLPKQGVKPFPMVLLVHGGPWTRDGWGYDPVAQWLADRGYACLQVNFRGSTGFGKKFVNAGNKEWGRKMQNDLTDAVGWAARRGIADPKRVGIMGASYGGYAALAAAAFTPEVFRCAVDMFGPSDLAALIRSMPPYWSVEKNNIMQRMGNPETEASLLRERSPLFFTDKIRIPILIAQGTNDPRTPKSESDRMVENLRRRKVECEYVVFPDEGHGFAKPANRLKFFKVAEAFLARHLGGRDQK
jgi:dipeptidyl aminopeptidase/acylaminoacyl peptidase